jgi:hypothetical protein
MNKNMNLNMNIKIIVIIKMNMKIKHTTISEMDTLSCEAKALTRPVHDRRGWPGPLTLLYSYKALCGSIVLPSI